MVHLQIINIAIQLNTLQVGYVSTCRLLYGSALIGWWTIIPLTYYSHSTEYIGSGIFVHLQIINDHSAEYIASGICVHLQIINIAIQLNTLQVGYVSLQIIVWFRFNRLVDNHPTNLL